MNCFKTITIISNKHFILIPFRQKFKQIPSGLLQILNIFISYPKINKLKTCISAQTLQQKISNVKTVMNPHFQDSNMIKSNNPLQVHTI